MFSTAVIYISAESMIRHNNCSNPPLSNAFISKVVAGQTLLHKPRFRLAMQYPDIIEAENDVNVRILSLIVARNF